MVLIDKREIVTNEENNNGDKMTPLENMSFDDDKEVYKEIGNVSLVVMRTLTT